MLFSFFFFTNKSTSFLSLERDIVKYIWNKFYLCRVFFFFLKKKDQDDGSDNSVPSARQYSVPSCGDGKTARKACR